MDVAIIGVGRMGRRHVDIARGLGLCLVGVCDTNPDALAIAGDTLGIPSECRFDDAAALLAVTRPECVIIATTAPTHAAYCCLAAEAGAKYILCEKPMATSLEACDRMIEQCRTHAAKLAINHQARFMEVYQEARRIVCSDAVGGLTGMTVIAGNCGMAMNGLHYFEIFRYMTGESPVEVTAWLSEQGGENPRGAQFQDRAGSVRLLSVTGKRLYMDIGADQGQGIKVVYAGRHGQLVVDELTGKMDLTVRKAEDRQLPPTAYGAPWVETTRMVESIDPVKPTRAVLEALLTGGGAPSGDDGRLVVAVLVAAYLSDERGHRPVRLDAADLPRDRVFPWA